MSSIGVAREATSTTPAAVIGRDLLYRGPIIQLKVPTDARRGVYEDGQLKVPYLQFSRGGSGGRVNIFVHTDEDVRNRDVKALAVLLRKRLDNGLSYLYLDLMPVNEHEPASHRLGVLPADTLSHEDHPAWKIFDTPEPVMAQIVFAEPSAKFPDSVKVTDPARIAERSAKRAKYAPSAAPASVPPLRTVPKKQLENHGIQLAGDGQLKRLLEQGWSVKTENALDVILIRTVNGAERTMVHHRPKPAEHHKHGKKR